VERIGIQFEHERDAHDTCAEAARRLWAAALSAGEGERSAWSTLRGRRS
jgi:hypothetical protein